MEELILRGNSFARGRSYARLQDMRRWQYRVREGDTLIMKLNLLSSDEFKAKDVRVKVVAVDYHHFTVQVPSGYRMSFLWMDFKKLVVG